MAPRNVSEPDNLDISGDTDKFDIGKPPKVAYAFTSPQTEMASGVKGTGAKLMQTPDRPTELDPYRQNFSSPVRHSE